MPSLSIISESDNPSIHQNRLVKDRSGSIFRHLEAYFGLLTTHWQMLGFTRFRALTVTYPYILFTEISTLSVFFIEGAENHAKRILHQEGLKFCS